MKKIIVIVAALILGCTKAEIKEPPYAAAKESSQRLLLSEWKFDSVKIYQFNIDKWELVGESTCYNNYSFTADSCTMFNSGDSFTFRATYTENSVSIYTTSEVKYEVFNNGEGVILKNKEMPFIDVLYLSKRL